MSNSFVHRSSRRANTARTALAGAVGPRMGLLQISSAAVLWGTTGVVVRQLHQSAGLGPVAIGFYRLLVAALLLLAVSGPKLRLAVAALRGRPGSLLFA